LFGYEWVKTKSPAGATQWIPTDASAAQTVPDAHDASKRHAPVMFTTDLALRMDPLYGPISKYFHENPQAFADAFARAWFKLTHRDMGPKARYLGAMVPSETLIWQDPLPARTYKLIDVADIAALKADLLASGLTGTQMVRTAWASASTFRGSDMRGGANGARIRLAPQKDWAANEPAELAKVLAKLETVQQAFNAKQTDGKQVSLADLIVLAGGVGVEAAAKAAGHALSVPFTPGRVDATQADTDVESFAVLEPNADGFRNYIKTTFSVSAEEMLLDKAQLLTLSAAEMTVLASGIRSMDANFAQSQDGVFTNRKGSLSTDVLVNLMDINTIWTATSATQTSFEGRDRTSGALKWTASRVDLVFGSNSQLRGIAEIYAASDAQQRFTRDFVAAWVKVMELDRFDLS
jgi:catalase-peroxidase